MSKKFIFLIFSLMHLSSCLTINQLKTAKPFPKDRFSYIFGLGAQRYFNFSHNSKDPVMREIENTEIPTLLASLYYGISDKYALGLGYLTPFTFFVDNHINLYESNPHFFALSPSFSYSTFSQEFLRVEQVWRTYSGRLPMLYTYQLSKDWDFTSGLGYMFRLNKVMALNDDSESGTQVFHYVNMSAGFSYHWLTIELGLLKDVKRTDGILSFALGFKLP